MKNTLMILFLLLSLCLEGQIVSSNCTEPQSVLEKLKEDATKLAVRRLFEIKSSDTSQVFVPALALDSTLTALTAVYNARSLRERDTIFDMLKITVAPPNVNEMAIASTDTSFTNQWASQKTHTGFIAMDSLLDKYKFMLRSYSNSYPFSGYGYANFKTPYLLNIKALRDTFTNVRGVRRVDGGFIGFFTNINGPSIYYEVEPSGNRILTFDYRWGEYCPSGCEKIRKWKFRIYPDCKVEYLGASGRLLDFVLTNSENVNLNKQIDLYPNPASTLITVSSTFDFQVFEMINSTGQTVVKGSVKGNRVDIDLSKLFDGIYFIKLINLSTKLQAMRKFVLKK